MKIPTAALVGAISLLPTSGAMAQGGMMGGNMMGGNGWGGHWMGGGYGGWLTPVLLVALIAVIIWAVLRGRK